MSVQEYNKIFDGLDRFQKARVYLHYFMTSISLKNAFIFEKTSSLKKSISYRPSDILFPVLGIEMISLWKNMTIMSFDNFFDSDKCYEWHWKFYNEINSSPMKIK